MFPSSYHNALTARLPHSLCLIQLDGVVVLVPAALVAKLPAVDCKLVPAALTRVLQRKHGRVGVVIRRPRHQFTVHQTGAMVSECVYVGGGGQVATNGPQRSGHMSHVSDACMRASHRIEKPEQLELVCIQSQVLTRPSCNGLLLVDLLPWRAGTPTDCCLLGCPHNSCCS